MPCQTCRPVISILTVLVAATVIAHATLDDASLTYFCWTTAVLIIAAIPLHHFRYTISDYVVLLRTSKQARSARNVRPKPPKQIETLSNPRHDVQVLPAESSRSVEHEETWFGDDETVAWGGNED